MWISLVLISYEVAMPLLLLIILVFAVLFCILAIIGKSSAELSSGVKPPTLSGDDNPDGEITLIRPPPYKSPSRIDTMPNDDDQIGSPLAGLGFIFGAIVLTLVAKKGFTFLKGVDWSKVSAEILEALKEVSQEFDEAKGNAARLRIAKEHLNAGDKISLEQASLLMCATLESGLKSIAEQNKVLNLGTAEGMKDIAYRLKNENIISYNELQGIKTIASTARNRIMHGDFSRIDPVIIKEQVGFVHNFLSVHNAL